MNASNAPIPQAPDSAGPGESWISALFDDALDETERAALKGWIDAPDTARRWREYALIGDAMRGDARPTGDFMVRMHERLAVEPTLLAPMRPTTPRRQQAYWLAAAATVAAIAWTVLDAVPEDPGAAQLARAPAGDGPMPAAFTPETGESEYAHYLAAHQDFAHAIVLPPQDMLFTPVSMLEAHR